MPDDNPYELPIPDFNDPGFQEQYIKALKAAYMQKDIVYDCYNRILHWLMAMQIVQIVQAVTLAVLAATLLSR